MAFNIARVSNNDAVSFFLSNSSGTVFHHPQVAEILGAGCEWWSVSKGSEPFQIFPIWKNAIGAASVPSFTYYFGPYWSDTFMARPTSSRYSDSQKIYKLVLEHLAKNHREFQFEFPHSETDMRAFLWWNHDNNLPTLSIQPRYSALIDGLQDKSEETLVANFRSVRRQEIKKAVNLGEFSISDDVEWHLVENLYSRVVTRSSNGSETSSDTMQYLRRLSTLLGTTFAECTAYIDSKKGILASLTLTMRAKGVTHLVLALTAPEYRKSGIGPMSVSAAILKAKSSGDSSFDFNGANSPLRGDDKHSYGATPALYFRVSSI